jgi:Histidine kinase
LPYPTAASSTVSLAPGGAMEHLKRTCPAQHPGVNPRQEQLRLGTPRCRPSPPRCRPPNGAHCELNLLRNHPGEHRPQLITSATARVMMSRSMSSSIRGKQHIRERDSDGQTTTIGESRQQPDHVSRGRGPDRTARDGLIEALTAFSGQCLALKAQNRQLAVELNQLHAERRCLRSRLAAASNSQPVQALLPTQGRTFLAGEDERRRLERDLHDGVQNELVALLVKLTLDEQDRNTPPALAATPTELVCRQLSVRCWLPREASSRRNTNSRLLSASSATRSRPFITLGSSCFGSCSRPSGSGRRSRDGAALGAGGVRRDRRLWSDSRARR